MICSLQHFIRSGKQIQIVERDVKGENQNLENQGICPGIVLEFPIEKVWEPWRFDKIL